MKLNFPDLRLRQERNSEDGQSIVLIAMAFVGLLAFVGLATDVGLAFVRSSEFSKAVDAASLAAVLEVDAGTTITIDADLRAQQFLAANGWSTSTLTVFDSKTSLTARGINPQYTLTVTWPVPAFFLRVIGIDGFPITHSATAAYFSQAELYTPTARDDGQVRLANQFISGQNGCTKEGDPVSPLQSTSGNANEDYPFFNGVYKYRIRIPSDYEERVGSAYNKVRIELFDTDSVNRQYGNTVSFKHSDAGGGAPGEATCASAGPGDRCVIRTGELLDGQFENPLWLYRVDENWDQNCNLAAGNGEGYAKTRFELYYIDEFGIKKPLAAYTDDNSNAANTDLQWVSPCNPGGGCPVEADEGDFEIDMDLLSPDATGTRSIYMDVSTSEGSSLNAWDLWAGPPTEFYTVGEGLPALNTNVNLRNLQLASSPFEYRTLGVRVFALGRQPMNHYIEGESVDFTIAPVNIDLAEQTIFASIFDYDNSPPPRMSFNFDTLPVDPGAIGGKDDPDFSLIFNVCADVVENPSLENSGQCSVSPFDPLETSCEGALNCDNLWMMPQLHIDLPSTQTFAGGSLVVTYEPDADAHVWEYAASAGNPFLTK
jgi:hypothetical protein